MTRPFSTRPVTCRPSSPTISSIESILSEQFYRRYFTLTGQEFIPESEGSWCHDNNSTQGHADGHAARPVPPARRADHHAAGPRRLPRHRRSAAFRCRPARPDRRNPPRDPRRRQPGHQARPRLARPHARAVRPHRCRRRRCAPVARLFVDLRYRKGRRLHRDHGEGDPRRQGLQPPGARAPLSAPSSNSTMPQGNSRCPPRRRPRSCSSPRAAASPR